MEDMEQRNLTFENDCAEDPDSEKRRRTMSGVQQSAKDVQVMVDNVVKPYSKDLDGLMEDLMGALIGEEAISTDAAERYYAELTNMVYFVSSKVETLNIYSDISKATAKEAYNKYYLNYCGEKDEKGKSLRTVAENTALAEDGSRYEATVNIVYEHAYKTLKAKVDAANEMITTLKNIIKRRVQEAYLAAGALNINTQNSVGIED